ncbi:MAG TPA: single-stranded DNA-binding protein [Phnomibacter sp.]|nr:single-stranded DNA-binding protein [Phnomibacter sp.]
MNNIRNRVQLIGRLGGDPEVKTFENNRKMAKLNIATNDFYQNAKGEKVETTEWHNVVAWGKLAERAEEYLLKGQEVMVEGKLTHRQYTDKEGAKRYITEVEASDLVIMGVKKASAVDA